MFRGLTLYAQFGCRGFRLGSRLTQVRSSGGAHDEVSADCLVPTTGGVGSSALPVIGLLWVMLLQA